MQFLFRQQARELPAYNAGLSGPAVAARYGLASVSKLSSNENPYGASPLVADSLRDLAAHANRYPDPHCSELRAALAGRIGVAADRLVFGNGSEDIIQMICLAALAPGDRVVTLAPSFGLHEIFPRLMGARVDKVGVSPQFEFDIPAWCSALARPARVVMLSTPSNPVGCALDAAGLARIVAAAPADALLVIDEAYHEYTAGSARIDSLALLAAQARPWIVLRTFSKAYGLAGLRIGYGIACAADLVDVLDRVRTPFNINTAAQLAALAALRDGQHLQSVVSRTVTERDWLGQRLHELERALGCGLRIAPSHANFFFIDTLLPSRAVAGALMQAGVIVKPWLEEGYQTCIRVTVGSRPDNAAFLTAFEALLRARR